MHITVVLGTARKKRNSERVYKLLLQRFQKREGVDVVGVDVRDHVLVPETIPNWGEGGADTHPTPWKDIVQHTDAFVCIIPEYNRGYPGEWKLLMDTLYKEYSGKRFHTVGVSDGQFAGVRVAEHIKPVVVELNFRLMKGGLFIGHVDTDIAEDGTVANEALEKRIEKFVDQVTKAA